MQTRKLGHSAPSAPLRTSLEVSAMGLGCMRMSFGDKPTDKQEMIDFLHKIVTQLAYIGSPRWNAGRCRNKVGLEK